MVEIIGTIVDTNRNLIGVKVNENGTEKAIRKNTLPTGFKTAHFVKRGNEIEGLSDTDKLNNLQMYVLVENQLVPINNQVAVIGRVVVDGEPKGFKLKFTDGTEVNYRTNDVAKLSKVFKPYNYVVRQMDNGEYYLAAKAGMKSLEELPEISFGTGKKKPLEEYDKVELKDFDILDIYNFVRSVQGTIIKLPSEKYEVPEENYTRYSEEFKPLGRIEVGLPYPIFTEDKLNVSMVFKKPGYVEIKGTKYPTYVNTHKKIFSKGESNMKLLGLLIPADKVSELSKFKGLSWREAENADKILNSIKYVTRTKDMKPIEIDVETVGLMSKDKIKKSLLSAVRIADLAIQQFSYKVVNKYLGNNGYMMKKAKEEMKNMNVTIIDEKGNDKIYYLYRDLDAETLNELCKAGINIWSGAFTKLKEDGGGRKAYSTGDDIEISYYVEGFEYKKITGKQVADYAMRYDTSVLPDELLDIVRKIEAEIDPIERINMAKKISDGLEDKINNVNETLWRHKVAMYLLGRRNYIHTMDKTSWVKDKSSRVRTASVYMNTEDNDLKVRFKGVAI